MQLYPKARIVNAVGESSSSFGKVTVNKLKARRREQLEAFPSSAITQLPIVRAVDFESVEASPVEEISSAPLLFSSSFARLISSEVSQ